MLPSSGPVTSFNPVINAQLGPAAAMNTVLQPPNVLAGIQLNEDRWHTVRIIILYDM